MVDKAWKKSLFPPEIIIFYRCIKIDSHRKNGIITDIKWLKFSLWHTSSLALYQEIFKMNFTKIAIFCLILSLNFTSATSATSKRRINLLRKFHNGLKPKMNNFSFMSSNGQPTKINRIMELPREQKIVELHRRIKIMLKDREKNRFKLLFWIRNMDFILNCLKNCWCQLLNLQTWR